MRILISTIFIFLTVVSHFAQPSSQPVLRIETMMHTAMIGRISVDRSGKYLVTASDDKTARVWDVSSGRLLQTLRIPIGEGNEGKIFATAISPDGKTIALGGWTGYEWDKSISIFLFDRENGKMQNRLSGLPNVIRHLTFSPDGRFLAAAVGAGVRVYQTSNWQQIGSDVDYGSDSYGVDFDATGQRLVTSCYDGFIRLYSVSTGGLNLIAKKTANGG